jgi:glycosyltransferase involved in cell wall biosynthesis
MKILFVHQNFPGQFKYLAAKLGQSPGDEVAAMTMNTFNAMDDVEVLRYQPTRGTSKTIHPWVGETETKVIRAEAALRQALELKARGFYPDLIIAHPGWGESLFLKEVWSAAKLLIYCEFYYRTEGTDTGFDPEFGTTDVNDRCRVRMKNVNNLLHFEIADAGLSPTEWQRSTYPEPFRSKIHVVHDGIDTQKAQPNPKVRVKIGEQVLTRADEVITFVNRNLEPYRGYHIFMRALPEILRHRPEATVLIVGGDDVSYGAKPSGGQTWKQRFFDEVRDQIDTDRVHFLGKVPYGSLIALLQLSSVHVYLTYPFVLSWSLLEAMSCACAIVASDTQPLHEAIIHDQTGMLTPFFDADALASQVIALLKDPQKRQELGRAARQFIIEHYDLREVTLPKLLQMVDRYR